MVKFEGQKLQNLNLNHLILQEMLSRWAHPGQTTSKQRCLDFINVYTTLFQHRLTMACLLGFFYQNKTDYNKISNYETSDMAPARFSLRS